MREYSENVLQCVRRAKHFAAMLKALGWKREDVAAALKEMFESPDGTTPIADAKIAALLRSQPAQQKEQS